MSASTNRPRRLYLDSDNRVSGTHDDFEVELPLSVVGCKGMEPVSATIPLTCYPVPEYERFLYFRAAFIPGVNLRATVNVSRNFTTVQELVDAVNAGIVSNTIRMDTGASISGGIVFTFNSTTRKVEFSSAGAVQFVGYLEYGYNSPFYHNMLYRLGFTNPTAGSAYYDNTAAYDTAFPGLRVFPSILRTTSIYVSCSLCQGDSMTSAENGNRDLLVKIPVPSDSATLGSVVQYVNNVKDITVRSMPHTFKRIRVKLLDEEQQPLGLAASGKGFVQVELRCFYE